MQADQIDCLKHWKSWTLDSPWHPDKGYPFKNAPFGAFFCLVSLPCWLLCRVTNSCGADSFYFIRGAKFNPIPPQVPKTPKTVMQTVMRCGIICGK